MPVESIMDPSSQDSQVAAEQTLAEGAFYWRERDGIKLLACKALDDVGFANGFSTRLGGVSTLKTLPNGPLATAGVSDAAQAAGTELNLGGFNEDSRENIYENRRRFLSLFPKEYRLATAWQVHADNIRFIYQHSETGDSDERADAVISNLDAVLAGVKTADCVPILIGDPTTGGYAAVHAGWRGTAKGIVGKAISAMADTFGSSPDDLICAIGPAAGCSLYEVGQDVMNAFAEKFSGSDKYFKETRPGHALADIKAANADQLESNGVKKTNIHISAYCTIERVDLFFSYRIEKNRFGRTGRLMSVIGQL